MRLVSSTEPRQVDSDDEWNEESLSGPEGLLDDLSPPIR